MVETELDLNLKFTVDFSSTETLCWASKLYKEYNDFYYSIGQSVLDPEPKTSIGWSRSQTIYMPGAGAGA